MGRYLPGFFVLACASIVFADPPGTAQLPTTLIYCDKSPGTIVHAYAWQGLVSGQSQQHVLTTTIEALTKRLNQGPWKRVIVIAHHQQGEPPYAPVVRAYCNAHPDKSVQLFIWHDNDQALPANKAVIGTTASLIWNRGVTTTGYAITGTGTVMDAAQAVTTPGLTLPNFSGIQTVFQREIAEFSVESQNGVETLLFPINPRKTGCLGVYIAKLNSCETDFSTETERCMELHGPQDGDPGNPNDSATCLTGASNRYSNCINAAVEAYNLCIKWCDGRVMPQRPAPAPPGGG